MLFHGNEATIQVDIVSNAVNKLNFQEMEIEIKRRLKPRAKLLLILLPGW